MNEWAQLSLESSYQVSRTMKLLKDNINENLDDLEFSGDFLGTKSKALLMKERIGKLNFIKAKSFCSMKDTSREWYNKSHT